MNWWAPLVVLFAASFAHASELVEHCLTREGYGSRTCLLEEAFWKELASANADARSRGRQRGLITALSLLPPEALLDWIERRKALEDLSFRETWRYEILALNSLGRLDESEALLRRVSPDWDGYARDVLLLGTAVRRLPEGLQLVHEDRRVTFVSNRSREAGLCGEDTSSFANHWWARAEALAATIGVAPPAHTVIVFRRWRDLRRFSGGGIGSVLARPEIYTAVWTCQNSRGHELTHLVVGPEGRPWLQLYQEGFALVLDGRAPPRPPNGVVKYVQRLERLEDIHGVWRLVPDALDRNGGLFSWNWWYWAAAFCNFLLTELPKPDVPLTEHARLDFVEYVTTTWGISEEEVLRRYKQWIADERARSRRERMERVRPLQGGPAKSW